MLLEACFRGHFWNTMLPNIQLVCGILKQKPLATCPSLRILFAPLSDRGLFSFRGFKIVLRSILITDRISVSVCPWNHVVIGFVSFLTKLFFWYAPYIILWYANVLFGMLLGELYVMLGWSFMLCSAEISLLFSAPCLFDMLG